MVAAYDEVVRSPSVEIQVMQISPYIIRQTKSFCGSIVPYLYARRVLRFFNVSTGAFGDCAENVRATGLAFVLPTQRLLARPLHLPVSGNGGARDIPAVFYVYHPRFLHEMRAFSYLIMTSPFPSMPRLFLSPLLHFVTQGTAAPRA